MHQILKLSVVLLLGGFLACANVDQDDYFLRNLAIDYESQKSIVVDSSAVATAHPLASEVGKEILRQGGNAIDAAIAIQYALAVVYPNAGNIGGGGFMVVHTAEGETVSIDFREVAPGEAHRDMYLNENGEVIPNKSLDGHLAAGIPGTIAGAYEAHKRWGKLPMKKLIEPAIYLAENGFAITAREAENLNKFAEAFKEFNDESIAFLKEDKWNAGDLLIQKDLAATLQRISDNGAAEFYEGKTAELITAEMKRGGGMISMDDLKNYKPVIREPRNFSYRGYQIIAMGLPSSGGVMLEQMLRMLEPYDLEEMEHHSVEAINHVVEVERRAYADRTDYMGDPDFVDVPVDQLLDADYIAERMVDFIPGMPGKSAEVKSGLQLQESEQTTHLSVLDADGNAVSVTTTLNTEYGSKVVVDGAGFFLNNEMDDFSAKPGVPNIYGLMGTEANSIEAGKRMVSSMTPTIVLKDDKPFMIVGTPGGSTIITSVLQSILNVLVFDLSAEEAVNSPKYHHQWMPDVIYIEKDFPQAVRAELEDMGYELKERSAIGRTELILVKDGKIHAVADKRGDDSAAGF